LGSNEFLSKSRRARYDITHYWLCNLKGKQEKYNDSLVIILWKNPRNLK
jgi:hypothetical protein